MAVNTHRTLSQLLFSRHGMVDPRSVFIPLWDCMETSLWTGELRPDLKAVLSLWKLDNCLLKPSRKTLWHFIFFCITTTTMVKYLSSLKEAGCSPLLVGSHLTVKFHQIKVTTGMAVNTHRTLSPNLFFSWNGTVCPRCVFIQLWNYRLALVLESHSVMSASLWPHGLYRILEFSRLEYWSR